MSTTSARRPAWAICFAVSLLGFVGVLVVPQMLVKPHAAPPLRVSSDRVWARSNRSGKPSPAPRLQPCALSSVVALEATRNDTGVHGLVHELGNVRFFMQMAACTRTRVLVDAPRLDTRRHNFGRPEFSHWLELLDLGPIRAEVLGACEMAMTDLVFFDRADLLRAAPGVRLAPHAYQVNLQALEEPMADVCKVQVGLQGLWDAQPPLCTPEHGCQELTRAIQTRPLAPALRERLLSIATQLQPLDQLYCIKVRCGDKLTLPMYAKYPNATEPASIAAHLLQKGVQANSALYIMSNEWDRTFFDPLRTTFRVTQFHDIPTLHTMIAPCLTGNRTLPCSSIRAYFLEMQLMQLCQPDHRFSFSPDHGALDGKIL